MKKTVLDEYVYDCFVDFNTIDVSDITNTNRYLIKKEDIK